MNAAILKTIRQLRSCLLAGFFVLSLGLAYSGNVQAQFCSPTAPQGDPGSCQYLGFPDCFLCNVSGTACEPQNDLCDDGNECTVDVCVEDIANNQLGCVNTPQLSDGATTLPIQCYVCEPTANDIPTFSNGICDQVIEDCNSDPADCGVIGFDCGTPATPLPAPGGFPNPSSPTQPYDTSCSLNAMWTGPTISYESVSCEDGDKCTLNVCTISESSDPIIPPFCSNPPITACNPNSDGCCPSGCTGPGFGTSCDPSDTSCDADCCSPEVCGNGDSEVQAPETCDDSLSNGEGAGIAPDGSIVSYEECRDPGTAAECTYCGDGIVQSDVEDCDGSAPGGLCSAADCNASCQCPSNPCLEGSGLNNNSGKAIGDCTGWSGCSLNHEFSGTSGSSIFFLVLPLLAFYFRNRARQSIDSFFR